MFKKSKDEEKAENKTADQPERSPRLRLSIPLSPEASADIRTKAACYRGQLTQEQFIGFVGVEIEQLLPAILRKLVGTLEGERRHKLGLDKTEYMSPVATEAVRSADQDEAYSRAQAAPSGPAQEDEETRGPGAPLAEENYVRGTRFA